jgi:hypothetical protein
MIQSAIHDTDVDDDQQQQEEQRYMNSQHEIIKQELIGHIKSLVL